METVKKLLKQKSKYLEVVMHPDERLSQKSKEVTEITDELKEFIINKMFPTMYKNNGGGFAAVQVGVHLKFFIIDASDKKIDENIKFNTKEEKRKARSNKRVFINPVITKKSKQQSWLNEGCLSFGKERTCIVRADKIKVEFTNLNGKKETIGTSGYLSQCIQHELDHLNGITLLNYKDKWNETDLINNKLIKAV